MKKILITGGAGLIGSHLCKRLVSEGNFVICLDNFFTGNAKNIENLTKYSNFKIINHDIILPFDEKVDEIYNLACPASPVHYQKNPVKTIKTSVLGVINMLDLAKKYNAKILQASTSEIYGDPLIHPQPETYWGNVNTIGLRSCYDEGKRCAETLMHDYHNEYGTDTKIVRIFNTYGPNMARNDGRVVSNFIIQALKDKPITIYGTGSQTRSFCYVDDTVEGIIKVMNSPFSGPFNIGNDKENTILEFALIIKKLINSQSKIIFEPLPQDDPVQRRPLLKLAKEKLNWEPKVSLENGLQKTIEFFKSINTPE
ncbi:MAG: SDR family oxidoreductase [Candidatus Gastranaerophilales bacterium]|nr:SDR family oxidoreductase [Candidatus Gastranaerophilales bacterium]